MNRDDLLEELNYLLLKIGDDEVDFSLNRDQLRDFRESLSSLILRIEKEGLSCPHQDST